MNKPMNTTYLKDYSPPEFSITKTALCFELDPDETLVTAELSISRNEGDGDLVLQGDGLTLLDVFIDNQLLSPEDYDYSPDQLCIKKTPGQCVLMIKTKISPANNKKLMGLYESSGNFCTQCEAEGFRRITYYLDRPDVLSIFTTKIIADKKRYPVLLSNGNLLESFDIDETHHSAIWHDPFPKPCYLFALVAGELGFIEDQFSTMSGRSVILRIYAKQDHLAQCHHAMNAIKKAMKWDEENYGREYDLDLFMVVAVDDFNFGAMENKGLNIFNAKFILASNETATDYDYAGIDTVVAHEYFHNWSGDRVTLRDWFQLSLKEGFTVYREQSFDEDNISKTVHRINKVVQLQDYQFQEDSGPMAHPVQPKSYLKIDNFYTMTIYNKGAEVIRMFHLLLGDGAYRKACDEYFSRYDGRAVTINEFAQCMQSHCEVDLTRFKLWYDQAGTPELTVTDHYDAENQRYSLTMSQNIPDTAGQTDKQPMMIPVKMSLIDESGAKVSTENLYQGDIFLLDQAEKTVVFDGVTSNVVPSLLHHYSAPVKCHYDYSDEQLAHLLQHETDGFSRWQVSQALALKQLMPLINDSSTEVSESYLKLMESILQETQQDSHYHAQLLTLPSEQYLARQMSVVDVDAVHLARMALKTKIAESMRPQLLECYQSLGEGAKNHYDVMQMARRKLRNTCLSYMVSLADQEAIDCAKKQFDQSLKINMTDCIAALTALSHTDTIERVEALSIFYDTYQHEPLVLNKWFALQAQSRLPATLDSVSNLMQQDCFNLENPNNVYALIYSFSSNNPINFHVKTGAGYRFLSDIIARLDVINPMVAARIIEPLTQWKRYDASRAELMKKELETLYAVDGLSSNVYECVEKSINQ